MFMKKKYKKKKMKTGVIAASAFGITATVVLAVVLLTTGIKEDTSKTDDILAGVEKIPEPSQSAALEQEPGETELLVQRPGMGEKEREEFSRLKVIRYTKEKQSS